MAAQGFSALTGGRLGAPWCAARTERFNEIEKQNSDLANLYVASYQLHGTVHRDEVLQAVKEIVRDRTYSIDKSKLDPLRASIGNDGVLALVAVLPICSPGRQLGLSSDLACR